GRLQHAVHRTKELVGARHDAGAEIGRSQVGVAKRELGRFGDGRSIDDGAYGQIGGGHVKSHSKNRQAQALGLRIRSSRRNRPILYICSRLSAVSSEGDSARRRLNSPMTLCLSWPRTA